MKYYSIYKGKSGVPKILRSWDECKEEVKGVKGAIYKSFKTEAEAIEFLHINAQNGSTTTKRIIKKSNEGVSSDEDFLSNGLVIFVDGSFMLDKKNYSYGLAAVHNGELVYEDSGVGVDPEAIALRNVSGEVMGSMRAVEYAIENNYKEVTIVFDYQGVESWALGTWKRNNRITASYNEFMQDKMKEIKIRFKKVKSHSGDKYNDLADKLAKDALING